MVLWIVFAILAVAVTGALLRPLRSARTTTADGADADLAIYRDQLDEIESDRGRGLINDAEAESARAEVARRILQRSAEAAAPDVLKSDLPAVGSASILPKAVAAAIPLASLAVYLAVGSPDLPGQPLASRAAPVSEAAPIEELISKVEARLKDHPEDGRGWEVIAPVYLRMGRAADSANAYSQAIRINGESAGLLVGFAEASLIAGNGLVSEEVRRAADRALALEPQRIEPQLWLGLGKEQDGDLKGAIGTYRALLDRPAAEGDTRWRGAVEKRLAMVDARLSGKPMPAAAPSESPDQKMAPNETGPSPADAEAVAKLAPEQQAQFIESMVARLSERLKANGKDLTGWQKLVRAYQVLGRKDEALAALAEAKKQFAGDAAAETSLKEFSESLGFAP